MLDSLTRILLIITIVSYILYFIIRSIYKVYWKWKDKDNQYIVTYKDKNGEMKDILLDTNSLKSILEFTETLEAVMMIRLSEKEGKKHE